MAVLSRLACPQALATRASRPRPWRGALRPTPCRAPQPAAFSGPPPAPRDGAASAAAQASCNPLEALRSTRDPQRRAALMQQLDGGWRKHTDSYQASEVEQFLAEELGVAPSTVMLLAVQNPALSEYELAAHVRPAVRALKAAGLSNTDAFFILQKRLDLLSEPIPLQRWLDFLLAHNMGGRDCSAFLLAAPRELFTHGTLHQAGQVVAYLRSLGVREEFVGPRLVCAAPRLLLADVDAQLRAVASYLMSLGLEVPQVGHMACIWPDLLLASVEDRLQPFVAFLRRLGASTPQVAQVLLSAPQVLRSEPGDAFGSRLRALRALGVSDADLDAMSATSVAWLTSPGGVREQVEWLLGQGLSTEQVRRAVVAAPAVLSEKIVDLERKMVWLRDQLGGTMRDAVASPTFLGASLMQVTGPRYAFVMQHQLQAHLLPPPGSRLDVDLSRLVGGSDPAFCEMLRASINEYEGFRTVWEEEYTQQMSRDAVTEFQDELKKLGIFEGQG